MGVCPAAPRGGRAGPAIDSEARTRWRHRTGCPRSSSRRRRRRRPRSRRGTSRSTDQLSEKSSLNESVFHSLPIEMSPTSMSMSISVLVKSSPAAIEPSPDADRAVAEELRHVAALGVAAVSVRVAAVATVGRRRTPERTAPPAPAAPRRRHRAPPCRRRRRRTAVAAAAPRPTEPPRRRAAVATGAAATGAARAAAAADRRRAAGAVAKPPSASPPTARAAPPLPDEVEMFWLTDWSVVVERASISMSMSPPPPPTPPAAALIGVDEVQVVEPGVVLADARVDRVVVGRVLVSSRSLNESVLNESC